MANRGYDVVVDVDEEGDLGHTDLQEDLEFHPSNFNNSTGGTGKIAPDSVGNNNTNGGSSSGQQGGRARGVDAGSSSAGAGGGNPSSKRYLWSIGYYQQFFDVDTNEVMRRCWAAVFPRTNFLDVLDGNPDLYGPVWIATTVVMILFLTGTMSQWLAHRGEEHFPYDFRLLSGGAGLIYGYTALLPLGLWGALRWFSSSSSSTSNDAANLSATPSSASILECWALYGYANIIWIPVALISWSPITILNYVFVGAGFAVSGFFLFRNLWPVLSATDHKTSRILLVLVVILHAGLAVAIKILFFAQGSPAEKKKSGGDDADARMLLF
ncbi:Yip1 domain family protein [Phyllosticta citriasiana]|uniref:Protein YIP n=1 Tax=Phyllosticta citriasiana TaxID=595635 RepID=A0ABR1KX41_9PEZI